MYDNEKQVKDLESLLWQVAQKINHHTRRFLSQEGLTMARFVALSNLASETPSKMCHLQRRLYLAPGTLTGLVDGLVEDGYAQRWREDYDRRAVFLTLTPKGEQLLNRVFAYRVSILQEALSHQHDIDLALLNSALEKIMTYLPEPGGERRDK